MNRKVIAQELTKLAKELVSADDELLIEASIEISGRLGEGRGYGVTALFRSPQSGNDYRESFHAKTLADACAKLQKLEQTYRK